MLPDTDLKNAVVGLVGVGVLIYDSISEKSFDFGKAMALVPNLEAAWAGKGNVIDQLKDLDSTEAADVVNAVAAEMGMIPAKTKAIISACLQLLPVALSIKAAFDLPSDSGVAVPAATTTNAAANAALAAAPAKT